ncbi:DNA binding domain-containing protein, excisionase family [Noviherbaspirillum suwonense]|uniref:DNA binding domain-containing protein, excisionase family n=2 Tax=Noviherbaspirillum suwonense TaxID=1224511 RepID=A0ABY1QGG8_9BURK|nr:DNA binding domain-containing protein, excisionase family [Noviherbaspirillum suwonense]
MAQDVCTTQQAASLLGMSVTSVQHLVESGEIEAWKTRGGHRRIPIAAVHAYMTAIAKTPAGGGDETFTVLIVEDNPIQRGIYEAQFASWELPVRVRMCENGYKALIDIAAMRPDALLLDIMMRGIDGYEVMQTVLAYPELADVNIAILTSLDRDQLEQRGGLPAGVTYFSKPVAHDELRGYIRACIAQKARRTPGK